MLRTWVAWGALGSLAGLISGCILAAQTVADAPGVTVTLNGSTILHRTAVPYPLALRQKGVEGSVAVEVTLEGSSDEEKSDWGVVKEKIRGDLKRFINREAQRRPLIMPVILEI